MFPSHIQLRQAMTQIIDDKTEQGHDTVGLKEILADLPDGYDILAVFAERLAILPRRDDWPYVEPNDWGGITVEADPDRPESRLGEASPAEAAGRIEAAFLGSVCGGTLGRPLASALTPAQIRAALEAAGEWPLRDYVSERVGVVGAPGVPDYGRNYAVLGMLNLEQHGAEFTAVQLKDLWLRQLANGATAGPARAFLVKAALDTLAQDRPDPPFDEWVSVLNPGDEGGGAMLRADVYGYACLGDPAQAVELAWRDASLTHRRTGIYGAIFTAAAVAAAPAAAAPLDAIAVALQFVPQRSRFYEAVSGALAEVSRATDWQDGCVRLQGRFGPSPAGHVFEAAGTLINTLRFAESVGDGLCKQVMQGGDTAGAGATAGSVLGAYFGAGHLEQRWVLPFGDRIQTSLAWFGETSLSGLARRMGELPTKITPTSPILRE